MDWPSFFGGCAVGLALGLVAISTLLYFDVRKDRK